MKGQSRILVALPALWLGLQGIGGCAPAAKVDAVAPTQEPKVLVCGPGSFTSGAECLPAKLACPAETVQEGGQCVALPSTRQIDEPPPQVAVEASDGELPQAVDSRVQRLKPRPRALLITEIQGLEALFASLAKDAPDRPALMRRLAIGYVELSAAGGRDAKEGASESERTKGLKIEQAARTAAIKYYSLLVQEYPKFCATPSANPGGGSGCADESQYYLALEYLRGNENDRARKALLSVIQNWPQSAFVGQTYFVFGEMFRKEAAIDPAKWALAEQAYAEAAKYTTSPIATLALTRRAEARQKSRKAADDDLP